jgi:hypothetical protein
MFVVMLLNSRDSEEPAASGSTPSEAIADDKAEDLRRDSFACATGRAEPLGDLDDVGFRGRGGVAEGDEDEPIRS